MSEQKYHSGNIPNKELENKEVNSQITEKQLSIFLPLDLFINSALNDGESLFFLQFLFFLSFSFLLPSGFLIWKVIINNINIIYIWANIRKYWL